jgi:hypothetical protein
MSTDKPTTLVEMIDVEFAFQVDLGFRLVVEGVNSVRYERSDGVFVRVFRDPNDKYVGFRIGLATRPRDALTATELASPSGVATPHGEYPERADSYRRASRVLHRSCERMEHALSPVTKPSSTRRWNSVTPIP